LYRPGSGVPDARRSLPRRRASFGQEDFPSTADESVQVKILSLLPAFVVGEVPWSDLPDACGRV